MDKHAIDCRGQETVLVPKKKGHGSSEDVRMNESNCSQPITRGYNSVGRTQREQCDILD